MPVITTNTAANTAVRYLNINSSNQSDNLARIASGSRVTKASDDASGLAIGTKLQADVAVLTQAQTNVDHGIAVLSVADGGLASISDILERMKTLATQAVSGAVSTVEQGYIDAEYQELVSEVDAIVTGTTFNGVALLSGYTGDFQAGTDASADVLQVTIDAVSSGSLSLTGSMTSTTNAQAESAAIDTAISTLSAARAQLGAQMSRFEFRGAMLATSTENVDAAQSAIMDADVASEQAELSSNKVLTQAAIAALSQANQLPQDLLDLLR